MKSGPFLNFVPSQALACSESRWRGLTSQMAVDQALIRYILCDIEDVPSVRCEVPFCCNSKAHRHKVGFRSGCLVCSSDCRSTRELSARARIGLRYNLSGCR